MLDGNTTTLISLTILVLAFTVPLAAGIYWKTAGPRKLGQRVEWPRWPPWLWLLLLGGGGLDGWLLSTATDPGRPAPLSSAGAAFALSVLVFVSVIAVLIGYEFHRHYDREPSRALRRAQSGDVHGAIAGLRAAMEGRKPSALHSATLGHLFAQREDWPEAYQQFLEAEQVGGRQADYLTNQGMMLWRMGRGDEAAVLMEEALTVAPGDFLGACNLCLVLADQRRFDEARERLAQAEANLKVLKQSSSVKHLNQNLIEALRKALAADTGARDRAVSDEE